MHQKNLVTATTKNMSQHNLYYIKYFDAALNYLDDEIIDADCPHEALRLFKYYYHDIMNAIHIMSIKQLHRKIDKQGHIYYRYVSKGYRRHERYTGSSVAY